MLIIRYFVYFKSLETKMFSKYGNRLILIFSLVMECLMTFKTRLSDTAILVSQSILRSLFTIFMNASQYLQSFLVILLNFR